jgi:hypothetical protein
VKNKLATRIIAIFLCVVTLAGLVAGITAGAGSDDEITTFLKTTKRVTQEQVDAAVANNQKKDFKMSSMVEAMGMPRMVMFNFGGAQPMYFTEATEIVEFLNTYTKHALFHMNAIIQLMWMDTEDSILYTVIATEYDEPTISGLMSHVPMDLKKGSWDIPRTKYELSDFSEYNEATLKTLKKAVLSSVQYPLLECNYTKTYLKVNDFSATWTTKVLQNKYGLMYILLKNGEPYQLYQDVADKKLPTYQKSDKLKSGLNEKQFLKIYPDAVKIQLFNHHENNLDYYIVSYAIMETNSKGKTEKVIYNIVDNDLYVYDENGNLMNPESGLVIEKDSFKGNK